MVETLDVSVVLPCLNEAESVGLCVREAQQVMTESGIRGEVVVVDNGSTDGSGEVASRAGARVIAEKRRGYGSALRAGIAAARGSIIVMADADWSYDLRKLPQLIGPIRDGAADLVLGSRLEEPDRLSMPILHRYVGTPLLTHLVRRAGGTAVVRDSQSGFRAFRREIPSALGLRSSGMEFASEMLIRAGTGGLRVLNVPTGYRGRIGKSKLSPLSDGWRHLRLILLLAPNLLLFTPGVIMVLLGVALTTMTIASPSGMLEVGSVRWQPVFFSTIALVLGTQSALMGAVLAHRSALVAKRDRRRFAFVNTPNFRAACVIAGLGALALGIAVDTFLFGRWVSGAPTLSRSLALASAAQSLLIVGGSLLSFAFVDWCLNSLDPLGRPEPNGHPK